MSETRCRIRPTNWTTVVDAHVNDETWDARWLDPKTGLEWFFPFETYEVLEVYYKDEPAEERPPCTCTVVTLMNRGCVCGHLATRYAVPR